MIDVPAEWVPFVPDEQSMGNWSTETVLSED